VATITSLGFNINSNWDGSGVREARNDLRHLTEEMRRLSGATLSINVDLDTARARAELAAVRAELADQSVTITFAIDEASYARAEARIATLVRDRTIRVDVDVDQGMASMRRLGQETSNTGGSFLGLAANVTHSRRVMLLALSATLAAILLLPPALSLVGGALTGGLVGAMLAASAAIVAQNQVIKDAWSHLASDAGQIFKQAGSVLVDEFSTAIDMVHDRLWLMQGTFNRAFSAMQQYIVPVTDALLDFGQRALRGMTLNLENAMPVVQGFNDGLRFLGTSVGNSFQNLIAGAEGFGASWRILFREVGFWLENTTRAMSDMAMNGAIVLEGVLQGLNSAWDGLMVGLKGFGDIASGPIAEAWRSFGIFLGDFFRTALPGFGELAAVLSNTLSPIFRELGGPLGETVSNFFKGLANVLTILNPVLTYAAEGVAFLTGNLGASGEVLGTVTVAWMLLNKVIIANPWMALAVAIAAIIGYIVHLARETQFFQDLWKNFAPDWLKRPFTEGADGTSQFSRALESVKTTATDVWTSVQSGFGTMVQWLKDKWESLKSGLGTLGDLFGMDSLSDAFNSLKEGLSSAVGSIMNALRPLGQEMMQMFREVGGALSGLEVPLKIIGAAFLAVGKMIWEVLQGGIQPVLSFIGDIASEVIQIIRGLVEIITGVIRTIRGLVEIITSIFRVIFAFFTGNEEALNNAMDSFGEGLRKVIMGIGKIFEGVWTVVTAIWDSIVSIFKRGGQLLWGIVQGVIEGVIGFFEWLWDVLVGHSIIPDLITSIVEWFVSLPAKLFGFLANFVSGVVGFFVNMAQTVIAKLIEWGVALLNVFQTALTPLKAGWDLLWNGIKAAADFIWGAITAYWNLVVQGFLIVWNTVGPMLLAGWNLLWSGIKLAVDVVWGAIKLAWDLLVNGFLLVWNVVGPILTAGWNLLWNGIKLAVDIVWGAIKLAWDLLVNGFLIVWNTVGPLLTAGWNLLWNGIKLAGEVVWNAIKFAWDLLVNGFLIVWNTVGPLLTAAWNLLWTGIRTVVEPIWNFLKSFWDNMIQGFKIVWDAVGPALQAAWNAVWNAIKAIVEPIWNFLKGLWDSFIQGLKIIWDTIGPALQAAWNTVWNAIKAVAEGIWNAIRGAWEFLLNTVRAVWDAFSAAISAAWNAVWDTIRAVAEAIWSRITNAWNTFTAGVQNALQIAIDWIRDKWGEIWEWVSTKAKEVWDRVTGAFNEFKDNVVKTVQWIIDEVKRIWDQITGIFQGPVDAVKGIWEGVAGIFGMKGGGEVQNHATGGDVTGRGTGTSDSIPAMLSNGEHVWTAKEVKAAGGQGAMYNMRAAVLNQGKGNPRDDNKFADGGALEYAKGIAREKGDGRAYVYGGTGPDGFDCSGYMSAIYNALTGRPLWARSFSTESGFEGLGFKSGLSSRFAVGIHRGGGGPNSHMAGTLDGVNVESGGSHNSTRYGGPAQGADSGYFELKYSLPEIGGGNFVSGGAGGGMGGPSPEQIAAHKKAVDDIKRVVNDTNATTSLKKWGMTIHEMNRAANEGFVGPVSATELLPNAQNKFGTYTPAGDVHGAGTLKTGNAAIAKLDAVLAAQTSSMGGVIPDGERRKIIEEALRITNTPPPDSLDQWLTGMNTLIQRESGWNAGAVNNTDINAQNGVASRGLAQVIPPTFEANKAPGHGNIDAPVDNVAASINYIKRRYGSITKVQQANANMPAAGYADGTINAKPGWNIVGENGPEVVKFRGGESVHTFDEIINNLNKAASSEATQLGNKLTAEVEASIRDVVTEIKNGNTDYKAMFEREIKELIAAMTGSAQASAQRLQVNIEDALERVLKEAGISVQMPLQLPAGSTPEQFAQSVAQQVLPQLDQMLKQHVNVRTR
jgi:SLT domain-containing protein/phage-related protein